MYRKGCIVPKKDGMLGRIRSREETLEATRAGTNRLLQNTLVLIPDETARTDIIRATVKTSLQRNLKRSCLQLLASTVRNQATTPLPVQNGRTRKTDTIKPRSNQLNEPNRRRAAGEALALIQTALVRRQESLKTKVSLIPTTL